MFGIFFLYWRLFRHNVLFSHLHKEAFVPMNGRHRLAQSLRVVVHLLQAPEVGWKEVEAAAPNETGESRHNFQKHVTHTSAWDSLLGQWVSGGSSWRGHASTSMLPDLSSPAPLQTGRCGVAGKQGLRQGRQDLQCGG